MSKEKERKEALAIGESMQRVNEAAAALQYAEQRAVSHERNFSLLDAQFKSLKIQEAWGASSVPPEAQNLAAERKWFKDALSSAQRDITLFSSELAAAKRDFARKCPDAAKAAEPISSKIMRIMIES